MNLIEEIKKHLKRTNTITTDVIKAEVKEIKELNITDEDTTQASAIATTLCAALTAEGIPFAAALQPIATKVIAYGLRDVKDGVEHPQKLIIARVIEEYRKAKQGLLD